MAAAEAPKRFRLLGLSWVVWAGVVMAALASALIVAVFRMHG
jgi:hypothetical protein